MNPTKTFTLLSQIPKAQIGKCAGILPNRMQCWRAGDVLVHQVTQGTNPEEPNTTFDYQLCKAHAIAEQQQYDKDVADEAAVAAAQTTVAADAKDVKK